MRTLLGSNAGRWLVAVAVALGTLSASTPVAAQSFKEFPIPTAGGGPDGIALGFGVALGLIKSVPRGHTPRSLRIVRNSFIPSGESDHYMAGRDGQSSIGAFVVGTVNLGVGAQITVIAGTWAERYKDTGGLARTATSVAVQTQLPGAIVGLLLAL